MGTFRFKRFEVRNERSAMKVNTDGVLLGAATDLDPSVRTVLDIGTGTGTVALMLSQRLSDISEDFSVDAIDVDGPSAEEAEENFEKSPWASHLRAFNCSLSSFKLPCTYDLVVSNPPYFDNSLQAPDGRRNAARHVGTSVDGLSFREILEYSAEHLNPGGTVSMVLPADQEQAVLRYSRMCGFSLWKILRIKTVQRKAYSRIIVRFKKKGECSSLPVEEELCLLDEKGKHTPQHASLSADFLL